MHIMTRWYESALKDSAPGKEDGSFQPANWDATRDIYTSVGVLKGSVPATEGYTARFLAECNAFDRPQIEAQAKSWK